MQQTWRGQFLGCYLSAAAVVVVVATFLVFPLPAVSAAPLWLAVVDDGATPAAVAVAWPDDPGAVAVASLSAVVVWQAPAAAVAGHAVAVAVEVFSHH